MTRRKVGAANDAAAIVQETEGAMSEQQQQKPKQELEQQGGAGAKQQPNIRLREGATPVTEGDLGYRGIVLPKADEQRAGWHEPKAQLVLQLYGTHYELIGAQG